MVIDMRDDPDWTIRYDFAVCHDVVVVPDFTIKEQLERYGDLRAVELLSEGIVKPAIFREDRPEGPWDTPSRDDLFAVFAPL